jgi:hypothetical protein
MLRVGKIFQASHKIGQRRAGARAKTTTQFPVGAPLPIVQPRDEKRGN